MDFNAHFNYSGKIATQSNLWRAPTKYFATENGITVAFQKVLGEQFFMPVQSPATVFYNHFTEKALVSGRGFSERMLHKTPTNAFKEKATAQDALGFTDSTGEERVFNINVAGWRRLSVPTDLVSSEMFTTPEGIAAFNSMLIDSQLAGYQRDMESILGLYAVSMTPSEKKITAAGDVMKFFDAVGDAAMEMMGDTVHYNIMTAEENTRIYTGAEKVIAFIDAAMYNRIRSRLASYPDADRIMTNVEFAPVVDGLPKPITTAELKNPGGALIWPDTPLSVDKAKPNVLLCDARAFGYRPVRDSYKVKQVENAAGDFTNYHLLYRGALFRRPWYNALRIEVSGL